MSLSDQGEEHDIDMSGLLTLSPELLTIIIGFVESQRALAQISQVCRLFNSIAIPILYSSFRQDDFDFMHRRVVEFLRTILPRPDLAQYVQQVVIYFHSDDDEAYEIDTTEIEKDINERIDVICSQLLKKDPMREQWTRCRQNHWAELVLMVLLCSLPNLQTLLITGFFDTAVDFDRLLYHASEAAEDIDSQIIPVPFSQLRSVRLVPNDPLNRQISFLMLHAFFTFPTLRNCEISGADIDAGPHWNNDNDPWQYTWDPRSIPVEKLSFQRSAIDGPNIANFVNACAHLKEFRFTRERQLPHTVEEDGFTPQQLIQALSVHIDTLEILHIDYGDDRPKRAWSGKPQEELRFGNGLREFSKLRKLYVTFSTFFGVDVRPQNLYSSEHRNAAEGSADLTTQLAPLQVSLANKLPLSLEELIFIGCDARIVDPLQDLATACRNGQYPFLSRVCCIFKGTRTSIDGIAKIEIPGVELKYDSEVARNVYDSFSDLYDDPMLEQPHFGRIRADAREGSHIHSQRPPFDFVSHASLFSLNPARVSNATMLQTIPAYLEPESTI